MREKTLLHAIARGGGPIEGGAAALFPWWSITKTALAVAVLRLVDQGKLSLDSPYEGRPYTIRQLLQHTAGLANYGDRAYLAAVAAGDPVWSIPELLARVDAERLRFAPGESFAYSNIGYLFVRRLIEATTGLEIEPALRRLVFEPLGVDCVSVAHSHDDFARVHWGNASGYDPRWVYHGLLIGSPAAAVAFLRGAFSERFLSRQAVAAAMAAREVGGALPGRPWTKCGYGLGLMIGEVGGAGRAWGHSGAGPGGVSALYRFPDLPGAPIVGVFARGDDEGVAECEAVRVALG
jgi:CubicO group peptidase (beta-lactamase class C family)